MVLFCKFCHKTIELNQEEGQYTCECTRTCVKIGYDYIEVSTD
jgi:hypothetical protein